MVCSTTIKFLISYGGRILLRKPDGKLRYVAGFTRVLAVDRSVSYAELMVKLVEFCGMSVNLLCLLLEGDLDTLITIRSDQELASVLEEYDRVPADRKIRAVLMPLKSVKRLVSPPESTVSSADSTVSSDGSYSSKPPLPPHGRLPRPHSAGDLLSGRRSRSPARSYPARFNAEAGKPRLVDPRYYAPGGPRVCCRAPCGCHYYSASARLPRTTLRN